MNNYQDQGASRRQPTSSKPFPPHTLLATLIACALALPAGAFAQALPDESEESPELKEQIEVTNLFEFGFGYVSQDSFRAGKYTGLEDKGLFALVNIDYQNRPRYDEERTDYVSFEARDAGLRSRSIEAEYGKQGNFRIRANFDQIPSFKDDSAQTIFDGAGSSELSLPANWVPAATTAGMSQLNASLRPVNLKTERKRYGIGIDKILPGQFEFTSNYRYEEKDGLKSIAGVIGNTGGNPRAALLPEPVNYNEHQLDVGLHYTQNKFQAELRYHLSVFQNDQETLLWSNPFSAINGWAPAAGFPTGQGQMALPPDNHFNQGTFLFGYNFSEHTRLSGDVAIGSMTQNDPFQNFTINPVLAASITTPLPRDSLNGEIDTTVINLRLSSRLGNRFHWNASLRYDDRDNNTPRDQYVYIGGDSTVQATAPLSDRRRFNEPYGYEETKLRLDGGYRFGGGLRITGFGEHREIDRTFSERAETREDTVGLTLSRSLGERVEARITGSTADRDGSHYDFAAPVLEGFVEGFIDTLPGGFENPPLLRRFQIADRERDQISGQLDITAASFLSFGLDASYSKDDYNKSELGLTESKTQSYTIDFNATPSEAWSISGFYTYDKLTSDQRGVSFQSGAARVDQIVDPARQWLVLHGDRADTGGFNLLYKPVTRFQFGVDILLSKVTSDVDTIVGSALTSAPLPKNRVTDTSIALFGQYQVNDRLALKSRIHHEHYRSRDVALDGVPANQLANVILFGSEAPDFDETVVSLSAIYQF